MIAAAFPPTGGPGVQRVAKFAKYLTRFGWLPTVWCMDRMAQFPEDRTLLSDLPAEVEVLRHTPRRSISSRFGSLLEPSSWFGTDGTGKATVFRGVTSAWSRSVPSSCATSHGDSPDDDDVERWATSSRDALLQLHEALGFSAIFSSFSPISNHRVAMMTAERTGLPWVADFRDLWTDDYRYPDSDRARFRRDRAEELRILRAADTVIGVTPQQTRMLRDHYDEGSAGFSGGSSTAGHAEAGATRFLTITNGFDDEDFGEAWSRPLARNVRFVMSHIGRLDRRRVSDGFLRGLAQMAAWLGDRRCRFLFRVVGHCLPSTRELLRRTGIACEFTGYQPHGEAIESMRASDLLLVVVPRGRHADTTIPAKPFEYLATGRPILLVGPAMGACAELVQATESGCVASHNPLDIFRSMRASFVRWERGELVRGCDRSRLSRFRRVNLASMLARELDGICTSADVVNQSTALLSRAPAGMAKEYR